jgi:hypothetical protein
MEYGQYTKRPYLGTCARSKVSRHAAGWHGARSGWVVNPDGLDSMDLWPAPSNPHSSMQDVRVVA